MSPKTTRLVLNIVVFQLGWLAAVLGGDIIAMAAATAALALHGLYNCREQAEWLCIALTAVIGCALDSVLHGLNILQFPPGLFPLIDGHLVPVWLACVWLLFATTLNHSLRWLQRHRFAAALLGAAVAPLSYWAGVRLGAARFGVPLPAALAIMALCWGLLLPLLSAMMRHRTRIIMSCQDC